MQNDDYNSVSPKKYSDLIGWYDISQLTGLNNNDTISSITDFSSYGYHLFATTTDRYPIYKTNIYNGLPTSRFDGIDDGMWKPTYIEYAQPLTFIYVFNPGDALATECFFDCVSLGRRKKIFTNVTNNALLIDSGNTKTLAPIFKYSQLNILTVIYNSTSSYVRLNGKIIFKQITLGALPFYGPMIGSNYNLTEFSNMDFVEQIIYKKQLNDLELWNLERYLCLKWGIRRNSVLVTDSFVRSDNSSSMGNCDSNHVWTAGSYSSTTLPTLGILSNYGYFPTTAGTNSYAYIETNISNCIITCNVRYTADSDKGIIFRRMDSNNYFVAHVNSATDTLVILRCLAGVQTEIGSTSCTITPTQELTFTIVLNGSSITAYVSDSAMSSISLTDSNLQTATQHGIFNESGNDSSFRNFEIAGE